MQLIAHSLIGGLHSVPVFKDDIQLELAHIIADLRLPAACDGLTGTFDSGVTEQILINMCMQSKQGRCPPSVDLRELYPA